MEDLGCIAIVVAVGAYIAAVLAYAVFVAPFIAGAYGLFIVAEVGMEYARVLRGVLITHAPEFRPASPYRPESEPEPAYRQYFFGPALLDLRHIIRFTCERAEHRITANAHGFTDALFSDTDVPLVTVPFGLTLWVGLAGGVAAAAFVFGTLFALHAIAVAVAQGLARAAIAGLRAADTVALRLRGVSRMLCPWCYQRNDYPTYHCDRCGRRHRDIRPGRYGVLRRRCACGWLLPTLLLLGSHRLPAFCNYCERQMSDETGRFREVVIPLLGGRSAGKTRLMAAMIMSLLQMEADSEVEVRLADDETRHSYEVLAEILRLEGHVLATRAALPRACSIRVRTGRSTRLVHIFDAAGERFTARERTDELRYLSAARVFVFVVDPMSVPAFWDRLTPAEAGSLDRALASDMSPETVFHQSVQTIIQMGARLRRARHAVAISKTDLIEHTSILEGRSDDENWAPRWLTQECGLGNLVRSMDHDFRDASFWFTAAVAEGPGQVHPSIPPLVSWCLGDGRRLRIASRRAPAPGPRVPLR
jgi:hypothetical protein